MKLLALLAFSWALQGGVGEFRRWSDFDQLSALTVATVENVVKLGPVPVEERRSSGEETRYAVRVRVRRVAFGTPEEKPFKAGEELVIYYTNPDAPKRSGTGGKWDLDFVLEPRTGQTLLFPLVEQKNTWNVQFDHTLDTVISVLPSQPLVGSAPVTIREFLCREIVHGLTNGNAAGKREIADFVSSFVGDVPEGLPRLFELAFRSDDDAWLDAGCAFLVVMPVLRVGAGSSRHSELINGEANPPFRNVRELVTWMLAKGDRREYPARLIRNILRYSGDSVAGTWTTLGGFRDSPVLLNELAAALRKDAPGKAAVETSIIRENANTMVLPSLLALSERVLASTGDMPAEVSPAVQLLIQFGDDRQFDAFMAMVRRFKEGDEARYRATWRSSDGGSDWRRLQMARVLIDDRRVSENGLRYCDWAAARVEEIAGLKFTRSVRQTGSLAERDTAVKLAAAWLARTN